MDLFSTPLSSSQKKSEDLASMPLAARMRPQNLSEYVGQEHILGEGKLLTRAISSDRLSSIIIYGPPGTGKTTLAHLISKETKSYFESINAVTSNLAELRKVIDAAKTRYYQTKQKSILFVDEIHRFSKSQQDVLMPDVENGNPILIGATTHNPFFSIIGPLLSRSIIFELKSLSTNNLIEIMKRSLIDKNNGFGNIKIDYDNEALELLAKVSEGDARRALNALEIAVITSTNNNFTRLTVEIAQESIQKKAVVYDDGEDEHYDTISAFIKSMRGTDADAAIYYLAKMLYAGEDPRFIARRMVIFASEDVGNADPRALAVAMSAFQATEVIGMPEVRINLAQAVIYLATAPKSNASYMAIEAAMKDVETGKILPIPEHLKDSHYSGAKKMGKGQGYKYPHDYEKNFVEQAYLSEKKKYYNPSQNGYEKIIKTHLENLQKNTNSP